MKPAAQPHPKEPCTDVPLEDFNERVSRFHLAAVPNGDQVAMLIEKMKTASNESLSAMHPQVREYFDMLQDTSRTKHDRLVAFMNKLAGESVTQFLFHVDAHLSEFLVLLEMHHGYPTLVKQIEASSAWPYFEQMLERHHYEPSKHRNPCASDVLDIRSPGRSPMIGERTPPTPSSVTALRCSRAASGTHTPHTFFVLPAIPSCEIDLRSPNCTPLGCARTPRSNVAACGSKAASGLATPRCMTPPTRSPSILGLAVEIDTPVSSPNDLVTPTWYKVDKKSELGSYMASELAATNLMSPSFSPVDPQRTPISHVAVHGSRAMSGSHTPDLLSPTEPDLITPRRSLCSPSLESVNATHGSRAASTVITPLLSPTVDQSVSLLADPFSLSGCALHGSRAASNVNTPRGVDSCGTENLGESTGDAQVRSLSMASQWSDAVDYFVGSGASCGAIMGSSPASSIRTPWGGGVMSPPAPDILSCSSPLLSRPVDCGTEFYRNKASMGTKAPPCSSAGTPQGPDRAHLVLGTEYTQSRSYLGGHVRSPCSDVAVRGSPAASGICTPRDFALTPMVSDLNCLWHTPFGSCDAGSQHNDFASAPEADMVDGFHATRTSDAGSNNAIHGSIALSGVYSPRLETPRDELDIGPLKLNSCISPRSNCAISCSRAASGIYTPNQYHLEDSETHSITSHDALRFSRPTSCIQSPSERSFQLPSATSHDAVRFSRPQSGLASLVGEYPDTNVEISGARRRTSSVPTSRNCDIKSDHTMRSNVCISRKKRRSQSLPKLYGMFMASLPNPGTETSRVRASALLSNQWFSFQSDSNNMRYRFAHDLGIRA